MESDDQIILKAVVSAHTLEDMIKKLQRLVEIGVPGNTILCQKRSAAVNLQKRMDRIASGAVHITGDDKQAIEHSRTTLWVEYEA